MILTLPRALCISDGALWFGISTPGSPELGRITTAGSVTYYSVPSAPAGLAAGPDHSIWFCEGSAGKIGRLALP